MKHNFTEIALLTAQAVIKAFETGNPGGDHAAFAVLNDGAGVSYGISQFTHRSGSLKVVLERYLTYGGQIGRAAIEAEMPNLRVQNVHAIRLTAANAAFKKALVAAAATPEMRRAQNETAFERYMKPAIAACAGSGFILPLSLAVVYDSITHGSYHLIRDRVRLNRSGLSAAAYEKAWITEYVLKRDAWLDSIARLRPTRYRMRFFLDQIATGRWHLETPLRVNGAAISKDLIERQLIGDKPSAAGPNNPPTKQPENNAHQNSSEEPAAHPPARQPNDTKAETASAVSLEDIERFVDRIAAKYDRIERVARMTTDRGDRAKSLWTTVAGTVWQTAWAIFGFAAGLPREVWLAVAVIAAILMLVYLYRQIALGRIREAKIDKISKDA